MKRIPSFLTVIAASVIVAGCATVSSQRLEEAPSKIRRGSTKKSEVIGLLGEPDHRRFDPGGETWIYGDTRARSSEEVVVDQAIGIGSGFIPIPYVGTAISGVRSLGRSAQSSKPSAEIKFDKAGVVRDYSIEIP